MKDKKHSLLIIAAALVVAGALMVFRLIDSPAFGGIEAVTVSISSTEAVSSSSEKVNINTATLEELMTLTDIGEKKARAIIDYREKNGRFLSADDLTSVEGIGSSTVDKNRNRITV